MAAYFTTSLSGTTTGHSGTTTTGTAYFQPSIGITVPSTTVNIPGLEIPSGITAGTTHIQSGTGTTSSGTYISSGNISSCTIPSLTISNLTISPTNQNAIMQNKVAVFKVTRNEENKIVSTEFIKEMWIETKNNESIDFIVARDKDLEMYKAEDLSIRSIWTVSF